MKELRIYENEICQPNMTDMGENWSNIVSELIRLTSHYCDRFLSDIYYDIRMFVVAIEEGHDLDIVLLFHENGVHCRKYGDDFEHFMDVHGEPRGDRAFFRLSYDPKTQVQKLQKLDVFFVRL